MKADNDNRPAVIPHPALLWLMPSISQGVVTIRVPK